MRLRTFAAIAIPTILAVCSAGFSREDTEQERARRERDAKSAAYEAGRVAHDAAKEADKAAKAAGRELRDAAREAREGWHDKASEERARKRSKEDQ